MIDIEFSAYVRFDDLV